MKIFLISNMYPSLNQPSYGIFVKNFEKSFKNNEIVFSAKSVIKGRGKNFFHKGLKQLKLYISIIYNGLVKDYDAIYVHYITHPAIPILILRLFKKRKLIINVHGSDVFHLNKFVIFLNKFAINLMSQADLIVTPSIYFKNVLIDKYKFPADLIFPSASGGVNMNLFKKKKNEHSIDFVIGYVSRIDKDKGWDTLLLALKDLIDNKVFNFKAIFVGGGAEVDQFQKKIVELELYNYIEYKGSLPQNELPAIINEMDIFVFPTRLAESLGLVGLEAMACGVPVIGANIGGLKDYIIDKYNGMFFEAGNYEDLAQKIILFDRMMGLKKQKLSENSLKTAQEYEQNIVTKQLIEKIYSII